MNSGLWRGTGRHGLKPAFDSGPLAKRPPATSVPNGYEYLATDVSGGTLYRTSKNAWTQLAPGVLDTGGRELGHAEATGNPATNTTTYIDITALTTTVTVGARPIMVTLAFPLFTHTVASGRGAILLLEDGVAVRGVIIEGSATASRVKAGAILVERRNPAAGSHTYKGQFEAVDAGTITLNTGVIVAPDFGPVTLHVVEC